MRKTVTLKIIPILATHTYPDKTTLPQEGSLQGD